MRSKRFFAVLLAFCMVFTALAPAASAAANRELSPVNVNQNTEKKDTAPKNETSSGADGLRLSEDSLHKGLLDMRENPLLKVEVENDVTDENKTDWNVKPAEGEPSVSLLPAQMPECLDELKEAAELFDTQDVVYAFVVMEGQALADVYTSRSLASADLEKQMLEKQNDVISSIEKNVLSGGKLEVRYQFTYLTNAFTIKTAFGNLEKIAAMQGVKSVFLTPVFDPATTATPNTSASGAMTGVNTVWENLGYTGTGMKIAIIDTGLDLDHPSFAAAPETNENSMTTADIAAVLQELNAYARRNTISAKTLYRSAKVPFAFNYVDSSLTADHSSDGQGDHGTHVAGIAAANALEGTSVVGMAPDAQIIVMKVFGANGGAYMDDVAAALEDAMTLGCDVVNASLGSPRGFASSNSEIDLIYERLASQDIVATFSAGNEGTSSYGNMWGTDLNRTQNPDNATVGSPSTWANTLSIASAENCEIQTPFFTLGDGTNVFFNNDTYANYYGYIDGMEILIGEELEYVVIEGLGEPEMFYDADGNSLVEGKVAVVSRGDLSFYEKIMNAQDAGAIACIIANNVEDDIFTMLMSNYGTDEYGDPIFPSIPSCMVSMADGAAMAACETKTLIISKDTAPRIVEGGQMSSFSSWGVSPDLQLLPDITGIGGNVYSCYDGGRYGLMSGTSMSAPQLAGISALVMQHLYTIYPDAPDGTVRELAEAILMSTADPIISSGSGVEASPRQQGAGLVDAYEATTTTTYLTVGGNRPKAELGDNANGKYTFSFEIHNIGSEDKTYTMSSTLMTEAVAAGYGEYFMYGENILLSGDVSFDKKEVTVPAGGRANVTVSIALSADDKAYFDAAWENGGYVEGYIYLSDEEGVPALNLPFLGFYGDWTDAPIFDTAYWYDNSFWGIAPAGGLPEGDEYYHVIWTDLAGEDWVLGFNPYTGAYTDASGNVYYDPAHNVVSPNRDGVLDGIDEIYLSLLRNAKTLVFTYTVDGEVMHKEVIENAPKTMYISNSGRVVPWIYSWYGWDMYQFTDKDGKPLPNGTEVLLTIDGYVDYGTGGNNSIQIPITVDTQAPQLVAAYEMPQADGSHYLFIELSENVAPAAVSLLNPTGTRILGQTATFVDSGAGTYLVGFDITELGTDFMVALCDYGCNEGYFDVHYSAAEDGNLPTLDTSMLYGYRVDDDHLMSDHMFGWVATNKPAEGEYANISVLTDDYLEYAAITAAEYAGGKVFAVDAVYNFVVMDPGLWNRTTICNLGVNVLDMAFDDVTDTMYLLAKDDYSDSYLYSVDLLTGELTEVLYFGYANYGPWAITFDAEGTLYAIKVGSSNLFTVDMATGDMTAITDAEGNTFVMTDGNGTKIAPTAYSQSITYSEADNTIYWAHYKYSWYGSQSGMAAIDLTNLTTTYSTYAAQAYDANNNLVDYYPQTEIDGLMVMEETDYVIPEATELTGIALDAQDLILTIGATAKLKASPNPWNCELGNVEWTSSNETVAVVDNGQVTALAEGTAIITASVGDQSAQCVVNVVLVNGNFYAYNYYSGDDNYGYMIDVDMGAMNYSLIGEPGKDFLAGDYNGHDGYFYGYTEGGQLWRLDMTSGEIVALGTPIGVAPSDMAYDYANGLMYATTLDQMSGSSVLNLVNLNNGELIALGTAYGMGLITLACDTEGTLYAMDASGTLVSLTASEGEVFAEPIIEGLPQLNYLQSMCYDHINDVLVWACAELGQIIWMDPNAEVPYALSIGNPVGAEFQFVGLFTIPETLPELADVAVESVSAVDQMILAGTSKLPNVTILPLNATAQNIVWTSSDDSIATVEDDGTILGVGEGVVTISGVLTDAVSGNAFDVSFQVSVMTPADNLYGHVLTDVATYGGSYWSRLYPTDPNSPDILGSTEYVIYAEEYYNGKLYAFGYDASVWSGANWFLFIMDPITQVVEEQILMTEDFPFVYDMTYDYATSTMYALAGPSENDTDLFVVNMETGELTLLLNTEQFFMAIAAGADGKLYAMENSKEQVIGYDDWGWEIYGFTNAQLYTIDPITREVALVGDTGIQSNMIASMTFDHDTGMLYWAPLFRASYWDPMISGLAIVNPETAEGFNLGTIGAAGAQVSGMYTICDSFPAESEPQLLGLLLNTVNTDLLVGETETLKAIPLPVSLDVEIQWSTSDRDVVTVDENGTITAVGQGGATVTATASFGGVQVSAECYVAVLAEDAAFLTYNTTDMGWAEISRMDVTQVTNLTEGEEVAVAAFTNVKGDVYGYDVENTFFQLDTETFERTNIGSIDGEALIREMLEKYEYTEDEIEDQMSQLIFEVRDMEYDPANDRILVLGNIYNQYYDSDVNAGGGIYEVDMATGEVSLLYTFHDHVYVMAMTVDTDGVVYFYNTFDDNYASVNLETGIYKNIINLQSLEYYGDNRGDHALYYDAVTGKVYHLFTGNNNYYGMFAVDLFKGTVELVNDYVGEVTYDYDVWGYLGDKFAGLSFLSEESNEMPELPIEPYTVEWKTVNTTLGGDIGLNYYVVLSANIVNDPHTYVEFTTAGRTVRVPMADALVSEKDGVTRYRFTCLMNAKNMTDEVTAQVYNAKGAVGESKTYSIAAYCNALLDVLTDAEDIVLVKAMLNYGAAAQMMFGYNTDDLANEALDEADKILADVDASAFAYEITGQEEGIKLKSANLALESQTTARVYYALTGDKTIDEYTFTIDGVEVEPVDCGNGKYYVELPNIAPNDLDEMHTFAVGGLSIRYSGLSYVKQALDASSDELLLNAVKALYAYYAAAEAAFA